jgi:hypothetical protein
MGLRPPLSIGRLDKALDEAQARGWTVVDMKRDWKVIFPLNRLGDRKVTPAIGTTHER